MDQENERTHTQREGNSEKMEMRREGGEETRRFLWRARTPVLKWEHEDRGLHPSKRRSQHPGTRREDKGEGGWSRNGLESFAVTP